SYSCCSSCYPSYGASFPRVYGPILSSVDQLYTVDPGNKGKFSADNRIAYFIKKGEDGPWNGKTASPGRTCCGPLPGRARPGIDILLPRPLPRRRACI